MIFKISYKIIVALFLQKSTDLVRNGNNLSTVINDLAKVTLESEKPHLVDLSRVIKISIIKIKLSNTYS